MSATINAITLEEHRAFAENIEEDPEVMGIYADRLEDAGDEQSATLLRQFAAVKKFSRELAKHGNEINLLLYKLGVLTDPEDPRSRLEYRGSKIEGDWLTLEYDPKWDVPYVPHASRPDNYDEAKQARTESFMLRIGELVEIWADYEIFGVHVYKTYNGFYTDEDIRIHLDIHRVPRLKFLLQHLLKERQEVVPA